MEKKKLMVPLNRRHLNRTCASTLLFRCVLHWFHGPLVAIIFPVAGKPNKTVFCSAKIKLQLLLLMYPRKKSEIV
jgi:hypothetical protein